MVLHLLRWKCELCFDHSLDSPRLYCLPSLSFTIDVQPNNHIPDSPWQIKGTQSILPPSQDFKSNLKATSHYRYNWILGWLSYNGSQRIRNLIFVKHRSSCKKISEDDQIRRKKKASKKISAAPPLGSKQKLIFWACNLETQLSHEHNSNSRRVCTGDPWDALNGVPTPKVQRHRMTTSRR